MDFLLILLLFVIIVMLLTLFFLYQSLFVKQPNLSYRGLYSRFKIDNIDYETLSFSHCENKEDLFIVHFPGNPGICGFYENYFSKLYESFQGKINIIGTSNKGLLSVSWAESFKNLFFLYERATIKDQVKYHLNFVKYLIKKHPKSKFILTAHSLGAYILLETLKDLPKEKILKGINLCPAIDNLSKSPKGMSFPYKQSHSDFLLYLSVFLFSLFFFVPMQVKKGIMSFITIDENILYYIIRLHEFNVGLNYINLGAESLKYVQDVNSKAIRENEKKLWFLYVMYDDWIPIYLFDRMRNKYKKAHFSIDDGKIGHAYIFKGLDETVEYVRKCIQSAN